MKHKLLNSLRLRLCALVALVLCSAGTAWGETVTFTYSDYKGNGTQSTGSEYSMVKTDVSITNTKFYGNTSYAQFYANGTTTFTPANGVTITQVVLTASSTGYNGYQSSGTFTASTGSVTGSTSSTIVTWTGSATAAFTIDNNKQIRWTSIVVTYTPSGATPTCATPVISGETSFSTSTEVSISCTTNGASIQYSTDGTTWNTYSAPFTITATTTVQAKATKSGMSDSDVASKTFTKIETFANIAAVANAATSTDATGLVTLDNAVVTYVNGSYAYIQDGSGAILYYKSGHGLKAGDVLNGTASVTYKLRNGNPQVTALSGVTPISGTAPEPTEVATSDWSSTISAELSKYYKITGATITQESNKYFIMLGNEKVQLYGQGNASPVSVSDLSTTYTVVGFPTIYTSGSTTTPELTIFVQPTAETTPREELTMTFEGGTLEFSDENNFAAPTLSIKDATGAEVNALTITYASNNTNVATVDATSGRVTIVDYGTATITATFAGDDNYVGTSASYTIVYTNPNQGSYTWDLTKKSYDGTPTADLISWSCDFATMKNTKGTGTTGVNNYIPTTQTSTRMYTNNVLTITPQSGYIITSVVFTATTPGYATAFKGSTWTNATAAYDDKIVTVTPTDGTKEIKATIGGTCGFTGVTVYYERNTTPTITIDPSSIEVTSGEATGTIEVTYLNIQENDFGFLDMYFCDAEGNGIADGYDWISASLNDDLNVAYTIQANTVTTPRTAYLKVNVGNYVSNLVTITQAAMVIDWVTLPYRYDSTGAMVDNETGLTGNGLSSYANSPAIKFENKNDKISYLIMKMNEAPAILYFDIKGNGSGDKPWSGTFTVQTSTDGETYTDLVTYTDEDLSGTTETKFFTDFDTDVRYIKWIYTEKEVGNVALGNIIADNEAPSTATIPILDACFDDDTQMYYGTYSNESAFVVPEDLTVAEIKFDENGLFKVESYKSGAVVPANTGVMVSAEEPGNYEVTLVQGTYLSTVHGDDNCLRPTGNSGIDAEDMAAADPKCTFYRLTMHNGTDIGFWWGEADGAAFGLGANKAYMVVPENNPVKGFALSDFVNGIKAVETQKAESNVIYNLSGQRVSKMQKGLYIVNGKKVLVK